MCLNFRHTTDLESEPTLPWLCNVHGLIYISTTKYDDTDDGLIYISVTLDAAWLWLMFLVHEPMGQ